MTAAILEGRRETLWENGRELKAQVWPDQFAHWFGLTLVTSARAWALLFPRMEASAEPATDAVGRTVSEHDFMQGKTEDRYPDHFGLAGGIDGGGQAEARASVADRLAKLPHHSVVLGHDVDANADFLAKVTVA